MPHLDIFSDPDLKNIYTKMVEYLSQADVAEKRLVDRIVRLRLRYPNTKRYLRYTAENARRVIVLLREQGFVNEERYARLVFDHLRDKKDGVRAIRRKMYSRQIDSKVIEKVLHEFVASEQKQDLNKIIAAARIKLRQLEQKYSHDLIRKKQIKQKLYTWLAMRGFSSEEMTEILKSL